VLRAALLLLLVRVKKAEHGGEDRKICWVLQAIWHASLGNSEKNIIQSCYHPGLFDIILS